VLEGVEILETRILDPDPSEQKWRPSQEKNLDLFLKSCAAITKP